MRGEGGWDSRNVAVGLTTLKMLLTGLFAVVRGLVDGHEEMCSAPRGQTSATPTSGAESSEEEEEEKLLLDVGRPDAGCL